jgi:flagellar basal body-associated protein FliL
MEPQTTKQESSKLIIALLFVVIFIILGGLFAIIAFTTDQTKKYEAKISELRTEVANQKSEKNAIRNIWADQITQNDKLVISQENLLTQVKNYNSEIANTFKFVDGKAQVLPTSSEEKFKKASDQLNLEISTLKEVTADNAKSKIKSKTTIDSIYIKAGEVLPSVNTK